MCAATLLSVQNGWESIVRRLYFVIVPGLVRPDILIEIKAYAVAPVESYIDSAQK